MSSEFGAKIVAWRKSYGCTQSELAGRLKISKSFLCGLEKGTRKPSLKTIMAISTALKIPADELIGTQSYGSPYTLHWCGTHVDKDGQYDVFRKLYSDES